MVFVLSSTPNPDFFPLLFLVSRLQTSTGISESRIATRTKLTHGEKVSADILDKIDYRSIM